VGQARRGDSERQRIVEVRGAVEQIRLSEVLGPVLGVIAAKLVEVEGEMTWRIPTTST
jgi:hypothetical protein